MSGWSNGLRTNRVQGIEGVIKNNRDSTSTEHGILSRKEISHHEDTSEGIGAIIGFQRRNPRQYDWANTAGAVQPYPGYRLHRFPETWLDPVIVCHLAPQP